MRYLIFVVGLALIGVGVAIWFGKLSYPDERSIVKVGNMEALLTRERPIPHWLGATTALTGLVIVLLGTRYRR